MAGSNYYLIVNILILFLELTSIICNGFILFLFIREKALCQNSSRQLVLFLTAADFFHALAMLPYTVFSIYNWNPDYIDLNPYYIMISGTPMIAQLKINLTLTISIAIDRTLALYFPITFRNLCPYSYAKFFLIFGFVLAALDVILEFSLSPIKATPNCRALGCFLSEDFRHYMGISNMLMGITVVVLVSLVLVKLRAIQQQPRSLLVVTKSKENKSKQANRSCIGLLLISMTFVTIPSVCAGAVEMLGFSLFNAVGPFYIVGIHCAGASSSAIYFALSKDTRMFAKMCFFRRRLSLVKPLSDVKTISTIKV